MKKGKLQVKGKAGGLGAAVPQTFKDRNLVPVNPGKTQFEPTEAVPVRQHNQMAGGA